MDAVAQIRYSRISPKKMKIWGKNIVGLAPAAAVDRLSLTGNKAARILQKVIISAMANAKNNLKLDVNKMRVSSVVTVKGSSYKRWQPVSRGMAHAIKKRTAHIKVILSEIKKEKIPPKKLEKQSEVKEESNVNERSKNGTQS